jgi:hypothetical protein
VPESESDDERMDRYSVELKRGWTVASNGATGGTYDMMTTANKIPVTGCSRCPKWDRWDRCPNFSKWVNFDSGGRAPDD